MHAVSPVTEALLLLLLGLGAGCLGGILGIGGSILMIPALGIILHRDQHLAQAAAMIVNLFVALPALILHHRAGAVRWSVAARMIPFAIVFIIVGVESSNLLAAKTLEAIFGAFLIYVIASNVRKLIDCSAEPHASAQRTGWLACSSVGAIMGFGAGLLGVGGGGIAVPLLQKVCNLPLRQCIATSTAVMCIAAAIGAVRKNATLTQHLDVATGVALSALDSLEIAAWLAPTAIVGGLMGAGLTHQLPLFWIRLTFILLMTWASLEMLGLLPGLS
jgi:hypothetical protein